MQSLNYYDVFWSNPVSARQWQHRVDLANAALQGDRRALATLFDWEETPQGFNHWFHRCEGSAKPTPADRRFLRRLLKHCEANVSV